ncbi:MAG: phasin family protein [Alcanivoracaceae bacterium]|jgi:phasin family protein|nr:phasin family protein [Alcanivoracaceae bacterium]
MNQEFLKNLTEQTKNIFAPLQRYNQTMIENMEKVTEYQLSALKNYSDMGLSQLKLVTQLDEKSDIADLGSRQIAWLNTLSKSILEDAQRMAELGSEIKDSLEGIVRDSMEAAAESPTKKPSDSKPKTSK